MTRVWQAGGFDEPDGPFEPSLDSAELTIAKSRWSRTS